MHRVFALLLALSLLFQASWAVAAAYCGHETAPKAALHFGHHAHVHASADGSQAGGPWAVDDDCAFCHAAHPAILPAPFACAAPQATAGADRAQAAADSSAPPGAPERPQWPRLA